MLNVATLLGGNGGGVTTSEIDSMMYRNKFSNYLPYSAYDDETEVYVNADGTIGFIWECNPLCFAGEKTGETLASIFRMGLPDNTVVQFMLYADNNINPFIDEYKRHRTRNIPLVAYTTDSYSQFLINGTKGLNNLSGTPVRNFRLFVSVKIPMDDKNGTGIDVREIHANVQENLQGARLFPRPLEPGRLLDVLRRIFNDDPSLNNSDYDDNIPIRKQVIKSETVIKKTISDFKVGERIFKCMTPKKFPKEIDVLVSNQILGGIWGMNSDTEQVKTPFIYTLNIVIQNLRANLHTKCNMVLQQHGAGSFAPSLKRKQEEYLWAVDEIEKETTFVRIIPILWIWGKDDKEATESIKRVKRIWESFGFIMQEDKGILPILFLSSLPFGLFNKGQNIENLDRDFIMQADTVADLLPVQADFAGGGAPILMFGGRKGQICSIDIFDSHVNNHNIFVSAGSGGGKSFLINYLVYNYYACDSLIRIIDIGYSYKKAANMFNGRFLDFKEDSKICLNPFTVIKEINEEISAISSIVLQMIYSATDTLPTETAETATTLVKEAVNWAFNSEGNDANIDTVHRYLNNYKDYRGHSEFGYSSDNSITQIASNLAFNLNEFTSRGTYGRWFNGKSTFDISNDEFVVLELETLKSRKDLFKVVSLQVVNEVTKDLYLSDRSRNRFIVFEESWQFLGEGVMLKDVIEEGYRRARKYGGSFSVVTQSILDIARFGAVGNVIWDNSAFKFFLESTSFDKAKGNKTIDYDDFTMRLLKSVRNNKPKYSEIFMDTPFGLGVARLVVDPYLYYINSSEAKDNAEIDAMVKGGMSYADAIQQMVKKYRS